jgi:hypothetical protein
MSRVKRNLTICPSLMENSPFAFFSPKLLLTPSETTSHSISVGFCCCPIFARAPPSWGPTSGKPQGQQVSSFRGKEQLVEGPYTTKSSERCVHCPRGGVSATSPPGHSQGHPRGLLSEGL